MSHTPQGSKRTNRRGDLGAFARAGFQDLTVAREGVSALAAALAGPLAAPVGSGSSTLNSIAKDSPESASEELLRGLAAAADPDAALTIVLRLAEHGERPLHGLDAAAWRRLCLLVGASPALGHFLETHPEFIAELVARDGQLPSAEEARERMLRAVGAEASADITAAPAPFATLTGEAGKNALRVEYRRLLADVALYDLSSNSVPGAGANPAAGDAAGDAEQPGARRSFEPVTLAISHLADAAIEAALAVARGTLEQGGSTPPITRDRISDVRLAVIAMGKCGAQELNVVSDVDVMFVAEGDDTVAMSLAREMMRAIHDPGVELPLWQVDANLRPEGQHGALVRSLASMMSYYERWAKAWEFQALMKARPSAGDLELGAEFVERTRELVWASAKREDFVGSVQRMRERVTEHIAPQDIEYQIKLGPGGLRDIEFSVQLLQLVHGQRDEHLRLRGTLPALTALVDRGYVARADGERLSDHYRTLRVLEHRLQLRDLRRTALMPREDDELRILARASGFTASAGELTALWNQVRREVRELHLKIFYAPLLSSVAALPDEEFVLGSDEARARLKTIGFADPEGAFRHLAALTGGPSRSARILRNLSPVLLQWFAEGTDPDYGLLAFRRVCEANRDASWYLRLLRDGSMAAERLARMLANSRFVADLLQYNPEGVAWLERDELLRPLPAATVLGEMRSLVSRRTEVTRAATRLRGVHRREILRLAMGRLTGVLDERDVAVGLDGAHTALLEALLDALRASIHTPGLGVSSEHSEDTVSEGTESEAQNTLEISLIGMGRFGGKELGFASDIDLIAVARDLGASGGASGTAGGPSQISQASQTVIELRALVSDPSFPVDLDFDLRPEGKNGPLVRSIEAYSNYYERWSAVWEAQALLRARHAAGDEALSASFFEMADPIRYPETFSEEQFREVRRIKARVEGERLPQGADRTMHLKLGPGGISDVEWLVQLLQLQHGAEHASLRTVSTLDALDAAVELNLLSKQDARSLRDAWEYASTVRSALRLWSGRSSDLLPQDWRDLAGIAGVLGLPRDRTSDIVEKWLLLSRRARQVFEREFFGYSSMDPYLSLRP